MDSSSEGDSKTKEDISCIIGVLIAGLIADSRRGVVPLVRAIVVNENLSANIRLCVFQSLFDGFYQVRDPTALHTISRFSYMGLRYAKVCRKYAGREGNCVLIF